MRALFVVLALVLVCGCGKQAEITPEQVKQVERNITFPPVYMWVGDNDYYVWKNSEGGTDTLRVKDLLEHVKDGLAWRAL